MAQRPATQYKNVILKQRGRVMIRQQSGASQEFVGFGRITGLQGELPKKCCPQERSGENQGLRVSVPSAEGSKGPVRREAMGSVSR